MVSSANEHEVTKYQEIESVKSEILKSAREIPFLSHVLERGRQHNGRVIVVTIHNDERAIRSAQIVNELKAGRVSIVNNGNYTIDGVLYDEETKERLLVPSLAESLHRFAEKTYQEAKKRYDQFISSGTKDAEKEGQLNKEVNGAQAKLNSNFTEIARSKIFDANKGPLFQAAVLTYQGKAEALVGGIDSSTEDLIVACMQADPDPMTSDEDFKFASYIITGPTGGSDTKSHFSVVVDGVEHKSVVYGFADPAKNIELSPEQMAYCTYRLAQELGSHLPPEWATPLITTIVNYSTGISGRGKPIELSNEAVRFYRENYPDGAINAGVSQFDAATQIGAYLAKLQTLIDKNYDPEQLEYYKTLEKNGAMVFVGHTLEQMNTTVKALMTHWTGVVAIGPNLYSKRRKFPFIFDQSRSGKTTDASWTAIYGAGGDYEKEEAVSSQDDTVSETG